MKPAVYLLLFFLAVACSLPGCAVLLEDDPYYEDEGYRRRRHRHERERQENQRLQQERQARMRREERRDRNRNARPRFPESEE